MNALRILVVEDEPVISMLLAEVLVAMGHEVCAVVATEAAAVADAERDRPDFMVVDAHLRTGSGLDAAAEILRTRFVPHVFITGDRVAVQECFPEAAVIEKPFSTATLEKAIDRARHAPSSRSVGALPAPDNDTGSF